MCKSHIYNRNFNLVMGIIISISIQILVGYFPQIYVRVYTNNDCKCSLSALGPYYV